MKLKEWLRSAKEQAPPNSPEYLAWRNEIEQMQRALMPAIGVLSVIDVVTRNDRAGRTKEEVLAAFDKAIEALPDPT